MAGPYAACAQRIHDGGVAAFRCTCVDAGELAGPEVRTTLWVNEGLRILRLLALGGLRVDLGADLLRVLVQLRVLRAAQQITGDADRTVGVLDQQIAGDLTRRGVNRVRTAPAEELHLHVLVLGVVVLRLLRVVAQTPRVPRGEVGVRIRGDVEAASLSQHGVPESAHGGRQPVPTAIRSHVLSFVTGVGVLTRIVGVFPAHIAIADVTAVRVTLRAWRTLHADHDVRVGVVPQTELVGGVNAQTHWVVCEDEDVAVLSRGDVPLQALEDEQVLACLTLGLDLFMGVEHTWVGMHEVGVLRKHHPVAAEVLGGIQLILNPVLCVVAPLGVDVVIAD